MLIGLGLTLLGRSLELVCQDLALLAPQRVFSDVLLRLFGSNLLIDVVRNDKRRRVVWLKHIRIRGLAALIDALAWLFVGDGHLDLSLPAEFHRA